MENLQEAKALLERINKYRKSGVFDSNGIEIIEGSIINADGYDSDLNKCEEYGIYVQCVEFYEGQFGSCIYSDFEPLSRYKKITVIGHAEQFRDLYESSDNWSGNLGEVLKPLSEHPKEAESGEADGWIEIKSVDDLPKEKGDYFGCTEDGSMSCFWFHPEDDFDRDLFLCEIKFYQPIVKQQPPKSNT